MTRFMYLTRFLISLSIVMMISGCAQQSPSHRIINETAAIDHPVFQNEMLARPPVTSVQSRQVESEDNHHASIWQRLLSLYALSEIKHERIDQQINWYLQHPRFLTHIQQRAKPYLYFILDEIEAKNIPGELALLPAIESAFKPKAYSNSRAAGLWQFIPSTGRFFGLKQNWWYDGRRDILTSTRAATRYLKQLNSEFNGNWPLALASYNAGKGNIRKAIRQNRELGLDTDYWSLNLTRETLNYVPRLLAIAKIFAHPEKYNITLLDIPNRPHFEIVDVKSQLDLTKAAEMAQISIDDFLTLNPGFNRWSTDPDGPHHLLIPTDKAAAFKKNLARLSKSDRLKWIRHKIRPGENLSLIAQHYQTSVQAIKQSNHLSSHRIHPGNHLLVPVSHKAIPKQGSHQLYTVKKGDSFWLISRRYAVSTQDIARWNQLPVNATLRPGQKLIIKNTGKTNVSARTLDPFQSLHYTVKKGDSLSEISRKFNVSVADLRKWNHQTTNRFLQPGQKLKVMIDITRPST